MWQIPEIWKGERCWVIGGGISFPKQFGVPDEVIDRVVNGELSPYAYVPYMKSLQGEHVIGVNMAYLLGGLVDVLLFGDSPFYRTYHAGIGAFSGMKISCARLGSSFPEHQRDIQVVNKDISRFGIGIKEKSQIRWNSHTGGSAINLAALFGAKEIYLLGFDMKADEQRRTHWHGEYKHRTKQKTFIGFQKSFRFIAKDAKKLGIKIVNVNPDSAITQFPKVSLQEVLKPSLPGKKPETIEETVHKIKTLCFVNHYYNPKREEGFKGGSTIDNPQREQMVKQVIQSLKAIPGCDVKVCGIKGFTVPGVNIDIDFTGKDPHHIPYESLNLMNKYVNEYDYLLNVEDDILVSTDVLQNIIRFDNSIKDINKVFLPNRVEKENGKLNFIDWRDRWAKEPSILFEKIPLKVASNFHSGILILSSKKYKYAYSKLDPKFRRVWWGGPMASAFAYFHIPFKLYRNSKFTEFHSVEHLDHWRNFNEENKDVMSCGVAKKEIAKKIIQRVLREDKSFIPIEVKIPYGLNGDLAGAYNQAMESSKADWVLLLDHDVFVSCNPKWYEICSEVVSTIPDKVGMVTCAANPSPRRGNKGSQYPDIIEHSSDIEVQIEVAYKLYQKYGLHLRQISTHKVAGFFMLVRKEAWKQVMFEEVGRGVDMVDWTFAGKLQRRGWQIWEIPGLYVYHRRGIRKLDWADNLGSTEMKVPDESTFSDWIHHYMNEPYPNYPYGLLIDKHKVKTFVNPIVEVAQEFAFSYCRSPEEIDRFDYSSLPASFVIKATHGSHMNIIVKDGVEQESANQKQSRPFNLAEAKTKMKQWLNTRFADGGELYYDQVERGVIIEEHLCEYFTDYEKENGIVNYKAWCFHGKIAFIACVNFNGTKVNYYDLDWNRMPFRRKDNTTPIDFPKPKNLNQMIEKIDQLLTEINNPPFVRVDLYNFGEKIIFGEFTHSPGKGDKSFIPLDSKEPEDKYELYYGKLIESELTIVTFKWNHTSGEPLPAVARGVKYDAEYVNKLYHAIERNLTIPHRFVCITDDPTGIDCETFPLWDWGREYGRCFTRLKLFDPAMKREFGKRIACIDLDTVITGNLDGVFGLKENFIIHSYYPDRHKYQQKYNGSLLMMNTGCRPQVFSEFKGKESVELLKNLQDEKKILGSDQGWINYILGDDEARFGEDDGIYHLRNIMHHPKRKRGELPKGVKMVMFSGNQDPSMGLYKGRLKWVDKNWV
jgi:hypothetical protein